MSQHIGLDFGARTTEIFVKGKGIVLREPTVAAVDTRGNVIAVGSKALLVHGRAPGAVTVRRPFDGKNITDFNLAAETLDQFLELAAKGTKKHVTAAVKHSVGSGARELLTNALRDCRTGRITLADSAYAALLGSGNAPDKNSDSETDGAVICDIGAGTVEVAYVRQGKSIRVKSDICAGDYADAAIAAYLRRKYGLAVTARTARDVKSKLALGQDHDVTVELLGTDTTYGMPRKIAVPSSELIRVCAPQTDKAAELIGELLLNLPRNGETPSTASKIVLVGGGAAMSGIAEYISGLLGRTVVAADAPTDCIANGLGIMLGQK